MTINKKKKTLQKHFEIMPIHFSKINILKETIYPSNLYEENILKNVHTALFHTMKA